MKIPGCAKNLKRNYHGEAARATCLGVYNDPHYQWDYGDEDD